MTTPTFTTKIDGKNIVVTLKMAGKSQDFPKQVWSTQNGAQYGPNLVSKEALLKAKAIVDSNIASMSAQEFATWLKTSRLSVNM